MIASHNMMNTELLMQLDSPTITNKYKLKIASFLLAIFFISSVHADVPIIIFPTVETEPVISPEDAADDPAIWINNADPKKSLIFGTDKKSGIYVYDLKGNQLSYSNLGRINNIDLRSVKGKLHIVTSNRTMSTLDYWIFDEQGLYKYFKSTPSNSFSESMTHHHLVTDMSVYGVCMGLVNNDLKAVITEEEGKQVQQWDLNERIKTHVIDITQFEKGKPVEGNEAEGCVYDDENETIFISREGDKGILKAFSVDGFKYLQDVDSRAGEIEGDPEGVSIYKTSNKEGYLVVSSQGNSTFNFYNRKIPYQYVGTFMILGAQGIDEVRDTDGIDVTSTPLPGYPKGMMVAQDGFNTNQKGKLFNQNFKYISFKDVLDQIEP
jgi:3-phytase